MEFERREQHPHFQHTPLNVSSMIDFGEGMIYEYRRTSVKKDHTDPYHHDMSRPYTENTIFARGVSAFNREDIFDLIVFLVNGGSRNFVIRVTDETRFTRNTTTAIKIYDFLVANKTTFFLEIDGKMYDYVSQFYTDLREKFHKSEASSLEKSRISKMTHQRLKKVRRNTKEIKNHFIKMMFVIGKNIDGVSEIARRCGMRGMERIKLSKFEKKNRREISKLSRKKNYDYAKCKVTGDYFVVPQKFSTHKDYSFKSLGFGNSDVMKKMFTENLNMHYLCCPKESFPELENDKSEGAFDIVHEEKEEKSLSQNEMKWLVEIYNKQYNEGDITVDELVERMDKLFRR